MPRYHFDVIGKSTVADRTGLLLPDDIHASDAADRLASELYENRPELRVRECAVLVTDDHGEEVHRAPIVKVHVASVTGPEGDIAPLSLFSSAATN
jgi:hypothetical protein